MHRVTNLLQPDHSWGLHRRLMMSLAIPLVFIAIISAWLDFTVAESTAQLAHDAALADAVYDIESHFRKHEKNESASLLEEVEAIIRSSAPDVIYFSVKNTQGELLAGDNGLPGFKIKKRETLSFFDGIYRGQTVRAATHRTAIEGMDFDFTVMETTIKRTVSKSRILQAMILPNLGVIIATLFVIWLGVRQGLLPLSILEKEIASRSVSDLREIDVQNQPAEIRPMLHRLNELFKMLQISQAAQQRFIGDAAHQLKTPLAGLQTQLDLAVQEGIFDCSLDRQKALEASTSRISHLLAQLLGLARAESSGMLLNGGEQIALDKLLEESATTFLDMALLKHIDLGFEVQPVKVEGRSWLIKEALGNLIDNALRYTPEGGQITVRCGELSDCAFIEVEDSGPGIPEGLMDKVFERFYRIPGAQGNGCGLGLPIIKEIIHAHAGEITLANKAEGGLIARLEFGKSCA